MVTFTDQQEAKLLEWAEWLDTTSLVQGNGALRNNEEKYCCLGVYVKNAHPDKRWKICTENFAGEIFYSLWTGNVWESSFLPKGMQKELGLDQIVSTDGSTLQHCFTEMNDALSLSFSAIAVQIRYLVEHGDFEPEVAKELGSTLDEDFVMPLTEE